jgi:toxin CptA
VQIPVSVSRRQQCCLLALFLLLIWPVSSLIQGGLWGLFLPLWLLGLGLAQRQASRAQASLRWDQEWLHWQGQRYRIGPRSCILPGALWLQLLGERGGQARLWLFADALAPEHYRALARAVHLNPASKPE